MSAPLLEIDNLSVDFRTETGLAKVLDGVSLSIGRNETLGIVGESGCGKSVTGKAVMRLNDPNVARVHSGTIRLDGEALEDLTEDRIQALRGTRLAMIFQNPMVSLNPVHRVGDQIAEAIRLHQTVDRHTVRDRVKAALSLVGIGDPARQARAWPHQFSGGMSQRAMIAMMLACEPDLLIADEPTTALDVTVQAQVLGVIRDLQQRTGMSVLLITHNLGVVAEVCDRVAVMYAGTIVETASVEALFARPRHPYTRSLLAAIPRADRDPGDLAAIPGAVPDLVSPPAGCRFHPRCAMATDLCRRSKPASRVMVTGHSIACHHAEPVS